jgi:hypothetical protein
LACGLRNAKAVGNAVIDQAVNQGRRIRSATEMTDEQLAASMMDLLKEAKQLVTQEGQVFHEGVARSEALAASFQTATDAYLQKAYPVTDLLARRLREMSSDPQKNLHPELKPFRPLESNVEVNGVVDPVRTERYAVLHLALAGS